MKRKIIYTVRKIDGDQGEDRDFMIKPLVFNLAGENILIKETFCHNPT